MRVRVLRYDKRLKRLWICGIRSHHGAWGVFFVLLGVWAIWDDRKDFPWMSDNP